MCWACACTAFCRLNPIVPVMIIYVAMVHVRTCRIMARTKSVLVVIILSMFGPSDKTDELRNSVVRLGELGVSVHVCLNLCPRAHVCACA
jgi:hypothetical protein